MYYPHFLEPHDTVGICAPSAGVGRNMALFEASLRILKEHDFQIYETAHVRVNDLRGGDATQRAAEVNALFYRDDVRVIMAAAGGDFLLEILPLLDWETITEKPKWFLGASDPTGILFPLTTVYDIATLYGYNAASFQQTPPSPDPENCLSFLQGRLPVQHPSAMHAECSRYADTYRGFNTPTHYRASAEELHLSGRCIGGCIEVIKDLTATPYENVRGFIDRYRTDGILWYFDVYSWSAENLYRTLLQMRYAGWFQHCTGVLFGRVLFCSSDTGMTYFEAIREALKDIPYIYDMDIGHTLPAFTMMNGAIAHVDYNAGACSLRFERK